ncbi:hypothetical protein K438DRAFT_1758694 [Mycena galopus ATCC 62051]|nr:hypothetical protein K438DRAFT_1758694 [Mycena galopus ATCC 62051]
MASSDQCAIGPDGKLLEATEITFYNDPDDANPLPPTSVSSTGQATQITQFFRRSERSRKQSSRLTDPNNAELAKRKAADAESAPRSVRPRHSSPSPERMDEDETEDNDDDMPDLHSVSDSDDDEEDCETDTEAINAAYEHTKALGDADRTLRKKLMEANPDMDDDDLDTLLAGTDSDDEDKDEDEDEDGPAPKDALGKALALVKQIRVSPQAQAFFRKMCSETGVPVLQLLGWIRTRWASMFTFLDRLILLRAAVNRFVLLADDSTEVPNLVKKSYSDFRLSSRDREQLVKIHEVLQEPANIQQSFSSAKSPTVWRTLPLLEALAETWRNMAATEKFEDMRDSIDSGLDNLEKWYGKTDDTDVYFICLALDPNIKTAYTEESWNPEAFQEGMSKLEAVFDNYYVPPPAPTAEPAAEETPIRAKVQGRKNKDFETVNPRDELKAYLAAPLENIDDVVAWWGVCKNYFLRCWISDALHTPN